MNYSNKLWQLLFRTFQLSISLITFKFEKIISWVYWIVSVAESIIIFAFTDLNLFVILVVKIIIEFLVIWILLFCESIRLDKIKRKLIRENKEKKIRYIKANLANVKGPSVN